MVYTGFKDIYGLDLFFGDSVIGILSGIESKVIHHETLGFCLQDSYGTWEFPDDSSEYILGSKI